LQVLSPHFAPMSDQGNTLSLTNDYALARVGSGQAGHQAALFQKPRAADSVSMELEQRQHLRRHTPPYTGDILTSDGLCRISAQFRMVNLNAAGSSYPATWCVNPDNQPPGSNVMLCIDTQANAQALLDALATLVVASGGGFGSQRWIRRCDCDCRQAV